MSEYMDTSVDPCQDFHLYACGNYLKQNNIPDDAYEINTGWYQLRDTVKSQAGKLFSILFYRTWVWLIIAWPSHSLTNSRFGDLIDVAQANEDAYSEVIDVALVVKIDVEESIVIANSWPAVFSQFGNRF